MDLSEFLLARVTEDEADAMVGWRWKALPAGEYDRLQSRVLADCQAKRRIVEQYRQTQESEFVADVGYQVAGGVVHAYRGVIRLLAVPYADHPDYRHEWKP